MPVLQIEHEIRDYDVWKAAFDRDPVRRAASGVRRYQVCRPVDDPNYIVIDLDFAHRHEAEAFQRSLEVLWASAAAAPALGGTPRTRIVDIVEDVRY